MSFVLRDVICPSCNDCRDLDLCRDPQLQVHRWNCAACSSAYDLGSIESALVAVVQQQERAYQLQDLKCNKCRNVSSSTQPVICTQACSGHACLVLYTQHSIVRMSMERFLTSSGIYICAETCAVLVKRHNSMLNMPRTGTSLCRRRT